MKTRMFFATLACAAIGLSGVQLSAQWALTGNAVGANDFLGTTNTQDLRIRTNNTERMRVLQSNGFVGIGNTAPLRRLHITVPNGERQLSVGDLNGRWQLWGGFDFHITRQSTSADWFLCDVGQGVMQFGPSTSDMLLKVDGSNAGFVAFGTTFLDARVNVGGDITPSANCTYTMGTAARRWGTVYACNGTIQTSDASLKENITPLAYGTNALMKLHPVSFTWKNRSADGTKLGLLAQEVQGVVPEVVKEHGPDLAMGIFYSDLIPVLVKTIQEQQGAIRARSAENDALRRQIADRAERISHLENLLRGSNE